jgi:hypothetical protein
MDLLAVVWVELAVICAPSAEHNDQDYFGSLSFDEEQSFKRSAPFLMGHIGEPISAIGSLDIP